MLYEKAITYSKRLEDPNNPVLGPSIKALYFFGLCLTENKLRTILFSLLHVSSALFVVSQFAYLYFVKSNFNELFANMSVTILATMCVIKSSSALVWQKYWLELMHDIAKEEIFQLKRIDFLFQKYIHGYIKYTRIVTYLYWLLSFGTSIFLITTPFIKYFSSVKYREEIKNGLEPLPQIFKNWYPFDDNKMPGYLLSIIFHIIMSVQGSGIVAAYDTTAVAIMSYLKGQMILLEHKCNTIFEEVVSTAVILDRIKECHRHHTALMKHYKMFNSLLSPTMFVYVLLCSISICASVVQFNSKQASTSQKLLVMEYTVALVTQLFIFCWHANEVTIQSLKIEGGIYKSEWWRGDVRMRKLLLLLAGKLNYPFIFTAGKLTTLSVSTFVSIMNRSYSFYTLMSQVQDD